MMRDAGRSVADEARRGANRPLFPINAYGLQYAKVRQCTELQ